VESNPTPAKPSKKKVAVLKKYKAPLTLPVKYLAEDGKSILWPDMKVDWRCGMLVPKPSCINAYLAILALGIECKYDVFHDRLIIGGHVQFSGELSDHMIHMLRVVIREKFDCDPGTTHVHDAAIQLCIQNKFDPVCDYLDGLTWDNVPQLDRLLITYMSAEDTPLNRQIGRLWLIAGARRARQPGCRFDQIPVLEGPEGLGKSQAIQILAGADNFSDATILGLRDKEQQEAVRGRWLYEIPDLSGMGKSEIEHVKAFASKTHDRARPVWGKATVDQPRRSIFVGTTNDNGYLKSQTGNRRFWPVRTGRIFLEILARDRDQLWAEAAHYEAPPPSQAMPM
jgi:putative DNA primase/helicase